MQIIRNIGLHGRCFLLVISLNLDVWINAFGKEDSATEPSISKWRKIPGSLFLYFDLQGVGASIKGKNLHVIQNFQAVTHIMVLLFPAD